MKQRARPPVRRYHDRVAGKYDDIYADAFWIWHHTLTWEYLKPFLPADQSTPVLDLGCGTGEWGLRLLKSGYAVTFVDISPPMLDQARRKASEMGLEKRASFIQADLMELQPLGTGQFALATAFGEPLGSTRKPAGALKEIRRVLTDDGVFVATLDNRLAAIDYFLQRGDVGELEQFLRTGRTHWLTRERSEQFELHTFTAAQARKLFQKAGFEVLSVLGKTVLPMRAHRELLEDPAVARRWARIEKRLAKDSDAIGRAPHLQIAARRVRK